MSGKTTRLLAQFSCPFCGKGFEQKSRLQRHTDTSHPPSAPSAADIERLLKGIRYPKSKEELEDTARQRVSSASPELLMLIGSLPDRIYRDSAEVAVALGELKSGKQPRSASRMAKLEPPSKRGGRSALKSTKISAAGISKLLKGITFPKSKRGIITYVRKQDDFKRDEIISVLRRISDKKYQNLVQLEKEIGKIK
jgi:hypothetical protein